MALEVAEEQFHEGLEVLANNESKVFLRRLNHQLIVLLVVQVLVEDFENLAASLVFVKLGRFLKLLDLLLLSWLQLNYKLKKQLEKLVVYQDALLGLVKRVVRLLYYFSRDLRFVQNLLHDGVPWRSHVVWVIVDTENRVDDCLA